jgi:LPXTG-site transpeptidase (sortase) family protein
MALKINRTITRITRIVGWGLLIIIVACTLKVFIWEQNYYKNETKSARATAPAVLSGIQPIGGLGTDKTSDEAYGKHTVEKDQPKYIEIERLGVKAIVNPSKTEVAGKLPLPSNIYQLSWYGGSTKPGNVGAIVISGISQYVDQSGIFKNLDSLEKGDKIKLTRGDNEVFEYTIESISITSYKDSTKTLPLAQQSIDSKETLSLVSVGNSDTSVVIIKATR